MIEKLEGLIPKMIKSKRKWLEKKFGDSSDLKISAVIVVGSVAEGKEGPDSDVDIYVESAGGGIC